MDTFGCEIRFSEDESGKSPGRLTGTLLTYGERAADRPEVFAPGSLKWPEDGIVINRQHDRKSPIVRVVPFVEGNAVKLDAPLPNTRAGQDAAEEIRSGLFRGLSVEFNARAEGRRGNVREIRSADVRRAGLVDDPSYTGSTVAVREKGADDDPEAKFRMWL